VVIENQEAGVEGVGTAKREITKKVQDVEA